MILDEPDMELPRPAVIRQDWIMSFGDLVSLMLAFFVLLFSLSSSDPSRVESAVSSLTEKFAKSAVVADAGNVTIQTGSVIFNQPYFDSVISALHGRDSIGEVKILRSQAGTLMVRLDRDRIFLPRTGVLSPEGLAMIRDIARAMLRQNSGVALSMAEIRMIGVKQEFAGNAAPDGNETPVIIRQTSRVARTLTDARVPAAALTAIVIEGDEPGLVMAFYTVATESETSGRDDPA